MSGTSEQDMPGDQDSTFLGWGQTHGKRDHRVMSRRWRWLETQEQLQCWDTHHGDRGGSSLSPRGPARDEVPARGCSHLVQKGFGDTGRAGGRCAGSCGSLVPAQPCPSFTPTVLEIEWENTKL